MSIVKYSESHYVTVLDMYGKKKNILKTSRRYRLFNSREVRIGKNCARGLGYPRQRAQFFPIRTDLGWGITFLFFSTTQRKAYERPEHFRAVIMARFATN